MVQTNVDTNKHKDVNLVFTNHGKEDEIPSEDEKYALNRDSKSTKQRSLIKDQYKHMQKHQKRICVFNLLKT
jgi:hypothetical protein